MTAARRIFLIGMPAAGKTTLGTAVARIRPQWRIVDTDMLIEKAEGMSVRDIFATKGEEYFRDLEMQTIREISKAEGNLIICPGGGAPCQAQVMEMMLSSGTVVWLDAPDARLAERVMMQPGQRPLLENAGDTLAALKALREKREPYYRRAHGMFDSSRLDTEEQISATARDFILQYIDI